MIEDLLSRRKAQGGWHVQQTNLVAVGVRVVLLAMPRRLQRSNGCDRVGKINEDL
jgi:hypothetical protein